MDEMWMEQIFFFLDVYSTSNFKISSTREKIIAKLHKIIYGVEKKVSKTRKFKEILIFLFSFFENQNNIEFMEKIHSYLILFDDLYEMEKMEIKILQKM